MALHENSSANTRYILVIYSQNLYRDNNRSIDHETLHWYPVTRSIEVSTKIISNPVDNPSAPTPWCVVKLSIRVGLFLLPINLPTTIKKTGMHIYYPGDVTRSVSDVVFWIDCPWFSLYIWQWTYFYYEVLIFLVKKEINEYILITKQLKLRTKKNYHIKHFFSLFLTANSARYNIEKMLIKK